MLDAELCGVRAEPRLNARDNGACGNGVIADGYQDRERLISGAQDLLRCKTGYRRQEYRRPAPLSPRELIASNALTSIRANKAPTFRTPSLALVANDT